jgi:carbamoyltransferase
MRIILGIQEAHDASAALMVDGEIVAAAQEERFTGLKGDYGYPEQSIAFCLRRAGVDASEIDEVALASHNWNPVLTKVKRNANFSVDDWVKEQREFWKPKIFEKRDVSYYDLFRDRPDFRYDETYPMDHLLTGYMDPEEMKQMAEIRQRTISEKIGIPLERIRTITHEDCHAFYAYFGSPMRGRVLVLTSEGIGDYSNGTVSTFCEAGRKQLAYTVENHLGHIYQYLTLILGMKPAQDEYKLMGLAPYANKKELERSYRVFERILKVEDLKILWDQKPGDLYFYFREALEGHRFDGIAGAVQKWVEVILCEWVRECVTKTGLGRFCFAGGVAQNIKACRSIGELDGVDELYVCPTAGDTSLPLGACYFAMWRYCRRNGLSCDVIKPLENIYLGPEPGVEEIESALARENVASRFNVTRAPGADEIAGRLVAGEIIGRCSGRLEFGMRALGNRSILADPRNPETIRKINAAVKFRDFWMPFAPTILAERERDYLVNPKNLVCPFMTMAFDSTPLARKELIAAMHPGDLTIRPQILEERRNPQYYAIVKEFERLTGVGALLNTSLNLHGSPIALSPKDALHTFENSELDCLILGDYLIAR